VERRGVLRRRALLPEMLGLTHGAQCPMQVRFVRPAQGFDNIIIHKNPAAEIDRLRVTGSYRFGSLSKCNGNSSRGSVPARCMHRPGHAVEQEDGCNQPNTFFSPILSKVQLFIY